MNPTPTPAASVAAKAITRRMPAIDDDNCRQQSTASTPGSPGRYTFEGGHIRFKCDPEPRLLPGVCLVPVGPVTFELRLVVGPLKHPDGSQAKGLCYLDECLMVVDANTPPAFRLFDVFHELGHAMLTIYNPGQREQLDEESICDAMGAFMAGITPEKYAEIVAFVTAPEGGAA